MRYYATSSRILVLSHVETQEPETLEAGSYSEAELRSMYQDILAHDGPSEAMASEEVIEPLPKEEIIRLLDERICGNPSTESADPAPDDAHLVETVERILQTLEETAKSLEDAQTLGIVQETKSTVPVILLANNEWRDLVRACVRPYCVS